MQRTTEGKNILVFTKINRKLSKIVCYIPAKWPIYELRFFSPRALSGCTKFSLSQTFATVEESKPRCRRRDEMWQHGHRCRVHRYGHSIRRRRGDVHAYTSRTAGMKKGENGCRQRRLEERPVGLHTTSVTSDERQADWRRGGDAGNGRRWRGGSAESRAGGVEMERRRETETSGETDRNGWRESNPCVTCHNTELSANGEKDRIRHHRSGRCAQKWRIQMWRYDLVYMGFFGPLLRISAWRGTLGAQVQRQLDSGEHGFKAKFIKDISSFWG